MCINNAFIENLHDPDASKMSSGGLALKYIYIYKYVYIIYIYIYIYICLNGS